MSGDFEAGVDPGGVEWQLDVPVQRAGLRSARFKTRTASRIARRPFGRTKDGSRGCILSRDSNIGTQENSKTAAPSQNTGMVDPVASQAHWHHGPSAGVTLDGYEKRCQTAHHTGEWPYVAAAARLGARQEKNDGLCSWFEGGVGGWCELWRTAGRIYIYISFNA